MTRPSSDFSVADYVDLMVDSLHEYMSATPEREAVVRRVGTKEFEDLLVEAIHYFQSRLSKRAGGTYIYGLREWELQQREKAIAEAMAVRPALSMTEVFRRAGVSKSAGYRILAKTKKAK